MGPKDVHLIFHLLTTWFLQNSAGKHLLVAYWGQTSSGTEKDLTEVCTQRKYDIVVIGFVVKFFGENNKDEMPEVNFSGHCWDPVSTEYPNLYKCPKIEEGIKACQKQGKKVLISLGGATGRNYLTNDKASVLALNLWDLFLGGTKLQNIRPFGSAILDGIDLDIEDHQSNGYAQLVKSLRQLENSAGPKKYLITGAPQCPYPDASLGPKAGAALGEQGADFNYVFVQFYNNFCHTGDTQQFYPNMNQWLQFAVTAKQLNNFVKVLRRGMGDGPKILVGMPAATGGAGKPIYYRKPEEVEEIYKNLKNESDFGGFMLWDASWDQQNVINGRLYSDHIADIIANNGPGPTDIPTTAVLPTQTSPGASPTTMGTSMTSKPTIPEITVTPIPADFCKGKVDGDYADPDNPTGYISCSGGITYKRSCPPGLVWNKEENKCDWPLRKYQPHGLRINQAAVKPQKQRSQSGHGPYRPLAIFDRLPIKPVYKPRAPADKKVLSSQPERVFIQNKVKGVVVRVLK